MQLSRVMARFSPVANPVPAPLPADKGPNLDEVRSAALRAEVGDEIFVELTALFRSGAAEDCIALGKAINAANRDGVRQAAHRLKGAAATLGYDRIAGIARELEFADPEAWAELEARLREAVDLIY